MSAGQMPPWLQEQIGKLQQSQQNLQSIMTQRQHLEMEKAETEKALEELKKVADTDSGSVKSDLPLDPETEIILSASLISTPDGIDTGFFATLDIIKKPHK